MLVLIHGDDVVSSRKKLSEILHASHEKEIVRLDGTSLDVSSLSRAGLSASFFEEKKCIVIESLLANLRQTDRARVIQVARDISSTHDVVVWEGKKVEKATIKKYLPTALEYPYFLPQMLFSFLGHIGMKSSAEIVKEFHDVIKHQDEGLVFAMILRQWRYLIVVKDLGIEGLPSAVRWQGALYAKQAAAYDMHELVQTYRQLLAIDVKAKSSDTPYSVTQMLDIFFLQR